MKIALVTEKYPPDIGGLGVSVRRLARLLLANGNEVQVITLAANLEPGRIKSGQHEGIPVQRLGIRRRAEDTLADWFDLLVGGHKRDGFDLLHAYFVTKAGFVAVYAGHYLGVPSVVSARGNDLDRAVFNPGKATHILYALQRASVVTANSRRLVRKAQALAPGREVVCIPNGVDAAFFRPLPPDPALAERLGLAGMPVIGFVGEARAKKGIADLLLAFRQIASERTLGLLLVGGARSGEDETLLKVFRKQNPGLRIVVQPYLPAEALPAYYNLMDVLAMPSRRDGLPNALLEAMACERAVLASDAGGLPDAILDGENGRLVAPGDLQALVRVAGELLDDASLRQRLGRSARATVLADFSLEAELRANLAVYRQALGLD
jgi:glycosyltransferase involved in cell wall biosynthesis